MGIIIKCFILYFFNISSSKRRKIFTLIEYILKNINNGGIFMLLRFSKNDNTLIIYLNGELDHHTAENVRIKIDNKIEETGVKNLILDFSDVNFMDSSGIGVVIGRYRKVTAYGGKVAIVGLKPEIRRVFELSGMFKIIKEYKNLENAILSF